MSRKIKILGVKIWDISFVQAKKMIGDFLKGQEPKLIVTPNPEILLQARKNKAYQNCLNAADLALPDGFGLRLFSKLKHTVTGVDITAEILKMANSQQLAVLCIVRQDGLSSLAMVVDAGKKLAPQARFLGWEVSKKDSLISNEANFQNFLAKNSDFKPSVILVGLGFPEQELWLKKYLSLIKTAKIGLGVGGVFDFWTNKAKRAPKWLRAVHLEWLWRFVTQPRRIKRIFRALVVFPLTHLIYS